MEAGGKAKTKGNKVADRVAASVAIGTRVRKRGGDWLLFGTVVDARWRYFCFPNLNFEGPSFQTDQAFKKIL